jgi:GNAT superfamily N-acetyltransferase
LVATDPADPATIYGYLVFERIEGIFVLHYVYVKHTFRAMGVMRQLMAATEQDFKLAGLFSHMTEIMERLALKYNLVYHPYILINYNEITAPKAAEVAGAE